MILQPKFRIYVIAFMTLIFTHLPNVAFAEVAMSQVQSGQMVATNMVVADLTRAQAQEKIEDILNHQSELRQKLAEKGLSAEEISVRLASLSDSEMKQLAQQMDSAHYGGDILIAILIVVLIIFLIKRI